MTHARRLRLIDPGAAPQSTESAEEIRPVKVALATHDMATVNAHFAGARTLAIYDVTSEGWSFVEAVQFDEASNEDGTANHKDDSGDDRISVRLEALEGCALLFVKAIGGPAAARVVNARIHPIKVQEDEPVERVLERVRGMLDGAPPPWLRKAMGTAACANAGGGKPAFMDDDEDDTR